VSLALPTAIDHVAFDRDGFAIVPDAVSPDHVDELLGALPHSLDGESRGGLRNLFYVPAVVALTRNSAIRDVARTLLGGNGVAVRALLFDKTPSANWKVAWHQDLTIAVAERLDVPGFGPWPVKAGVIHVQAPTNVLEQMVAIRLHLDPCGPDNGPVRVLPGSHRSGKLTNESVDDWRKRFNAITCVVPRGGLLAMRPLLLHASSPAFVPAHRRVIHIEFAVGTLPGGLTWRWQI
jgi:ectoine hydroxylase-related dioxygenase (phytanoyl-CoA dioxygenase family)